MEEKKRVLVCEDDPVQLAILRAAFGQAGYDTAGARSPQEALASGPADLVVADIHLRQGDAFDLIAGLRRSGRDAPTLMISGEVTPLLQERAIRAGARGLIGKPCDVPSIVRVVRGLLAPPELRAPKPILCPAPEIVGRADGDVPSTPPPPARKAGRPEAPRTSTSDGPSWTCLWVASLLLTLAAAAAASVLGW
jgi:CheY-like chemotaxis protein